MIKDRVKTDILILIRQEHVANVLMKIENHEFRKHQIPEVVQRFRIYDPQPISALAQVVLVSPVKRKDKIEGPATGLTQRRGVRCIYKSSENEGLGLPHSLTSRDPYIFVELRRTQDRRQTASSLVRW